MQSASCVQVLEQAVGPVVHPPSWKTPTPRHASPAPHSESEPQAVPADLRGVPLQARRIVDAKESVSAIPVSIASDRRGAASFVQSGASVP
jgi:hypothetical protein